MTRSRSGEAAFRPRARLLRLIGAELISDEVVAITELVKNAHDADASRVTVRFRGVTKPDGEITITDDGDGMDIETLLGIWMEPGATSRDSATRHRTARGRRVLGEKGVGRFAVDKLAQRLDLVTRKSGSSEEIRATFDWDEFVGQSMLADVKVRWESRPAEDIRTHGTILRMSGLRSEWTERLFRRLSTRLSRLRSPFRGRADFSLAVDSDEFPQYSGELRPDFLDRAPYRIECRFDGMQTLETTLGQGRPARQAWAGSLLACGPLRIKLFAFNLETEAVAAIGPRMEARAWLKEWSGVSVYRDGFRIWPYGEPHDDWLRLDQRRVNNPVVRLSNNQIVGFVEISRDGNPELRDQTNREGLLHNEALQDLRRLVYYTLEILESERQSRRHPTSGHSTSSGRGARNGVPLPAKMALELAKQAPKGVAAKLRQLAKAIASLSDRDEHLRRQHVHAFAELAAASRVVGLLGPSVQRLAREIGTDCENLWSMVSGMSGSGKRRRSTLIRSIRTAVQELDSGVVELMQVSDGPRGRRPIDVATELRRCRRALQPVLGESGIEMQVLVAGARLLRTEMRPDTFRHLMTLIIENSIDWTRGVREPKIRVLASVRGDRCEITVSDNGPGIPETIVPRIFDPFFSRKEGGRGLGLAIARSIVTSHRGAIDVVLDGRRTGATVRLSLPRKRSRATVHDA